MMSRGSHPKLAGTARLRFDRKTRQYMLLYPERGMILNCTAVDIVVLCTGVHNVDAIADRLLVKYAGLSREKLQEDLLRFLSILERRGLVREAASRPEEEK